MAKNGKESSIKHFGSWEVYGWVKSITTSKECWKAAKFTLKGVQIKAWEFRCLWKAD